MIVGGRKLKEITIYDKESGQAIAVISDESVSLKPGLEIITEEHPYGDNILVRPGNALIDETERIHLVTAADENFFVVAPLTSNGISSVTCEYEKSRTYPNNASFKKLSDFGFELFKDDLEVE